jgi:hypothetical protein
MSKGETMTNLVDVLEDRRRAAGNNGKPIGYKAWGQRLGIVHTTLFRFAKGDCTLGVVPLRVLATWANDRNDSELIESLRKYVLRRFAEGDGSLGSIAVQALAARTTDSLLVPLVDLALGLG